jgi:hypothetical protein
MLSLNSTLPGEVPPPPDDEGSRCHLLGTTGIIVQFISESSSSFMTPLVRISYDIDLRMSTLAME